MSCVCGKAAENVNTSPDEEENEAEAGTDGLVRDKRPTDRGLAGSPGRRPPGHWLSTAPPGPGPCPRSLSAETFPP